MNKRISQMLSSMVAIIFAIVILCSCKAEDVKDVGEVDYGNFLDYVEPNDLNFTTIMINANELSGSSETDLVKADILYVLGIADRNYSNENSAYTYVSIGSGSATAGVEGSMVVRSFTIKEGNEKYFQSVGQVVDGNPSSLLRPAQCLLDQGKREYIVYANNGSWTKYTQAPEHDGIKDMDADEIFPDEFPYADCDWDEADVEILLSTEPDGLPEINALALDKNLSITDFVVNSDSILDNENLKFSSEEIDGHTLYTIGYEIDLTSQEKRDMYTAYPRRDLRKTSESNNLEYVRYIVTMKVWENGLIYSYATDEKWDATLKVLVDISGSSESKSTAYYSWHKDDASISNFIEDDIIDDLDWIDD